MSQKPERPSSLVKLSVSPDETPEWLKGSVVLKDAPVSGSTITGHLCGLDEEGRVLFAPEDGGAPFAVAVAMPVSDGVIVRAVRRGARALVLRTADVTPRWLLVGLVRERVGEKARDAKPGRLEVSVDGEKVRLEAEHDIELRCGQASITLRYDGRIELRGTHILSASRGPNRVKGATIALN